MHADRLVPGGTDALVALGMRRQSGRHGGYSDDDADDSDDEISEDDCGWEGSYVVDFELRVEIPALLNSDIWSGTAQVEVVR